LDPSVVTVDDLSAILEGMPLSDVKAAVSQVNPEIRALIGAHALNTKVWTILRIKVCESRKRGILS
jgi:hypothetical protein